MGAWDSFAADRPDARKTAMADLKVRNLDDHVAAVLKARARQKGISLEEEVRRTLALSVARDRAELVERAKALHAAAGGRPGPPELDSARVIREERDAWG
jgi:plasmid stability protein